MARKGKKRDIQVWGVTLLDGTQITNDDEGIVSVIANGDKTITVTDVENNHKILEDPTGKPLEWAAYVPRFN